MTADDIASAIALLKCLKSQLMHARRFGPDTLEAYRRACSNAEGDVEQWLITHGHAKSQDTALTTTPATAGNTKGNDDDTRYAERPRG